MLERACRPTYPGMARDYLCVHKSLDLIESFVKANLLRQRLGRESVAVELEARLESTVRRTRVGQKCLKNKQKKKKQENGLTREGRE